MFNATRIRERSLAEHVEVHHELDSTNDRAIELVRRNETPTPALIVAEHQTAGRGQRGRSWFSGDGSLTFSWIAPRLERSEFGSLPTGLLPLATALAIVDGIETVALLTGIQIKWPNDLIVAERKLCGVLIESVSVGSEQFVVVGIGINVNNQDISRTQTDNPDPTRPASLAPTSILMETQQHISIEELLLAIIDRLGSEFSQSLTPPSTLIDRCNSRLAYLGQPVIFTTPQGASTTGICEGVSRDGGLLIRSNEGLQTVTSGACSRLIGPK